MNRQVSYRSLIIDPNRLKSSNVNQKNYIEFKFLKPNFSC